MKIYSNDAVTTSKLDDLDQKQSREIEKLRLYVIILAVSQFVMFGMTVGLFLMSN